MLLQGDEEMHSRTQQRGQLCAHWILPEQHCLENPEISLTFMSEREQFGFEFYTIESRSLFLLSGGLRCPPEKCLSREITLSYVSEKNGINVP